MNNVDLSKRIKIQAIYGVFWLGITGVTVSFLNPWFGVIPAWFTFASVSASVSGRRYMKNLIKSIRLHEDKERCVFEVANGSIINANIANNDIINLVDVVPLIKGEEELVNKSSINRRANATEMQTMSFYSRLSTKTTIKNIINCA